MDTIKDPLISMIADIYSEDEKKQEIKKFANYLREVANNMEQLSDGDDFKEWGNMILENIPLKLKTDLSVRF
jgi:hypothetical protein